MGATTGIAWTDHTFNPWWGCTRVSPGCENCYAETFDHRLGGAHWGVTAERKTFGDKHWNEPLRWNLDAEKRGERARVFCASMADVFDKDAPAGALERLWALIRSTPHLDWQLLTKRPERINESLPPDWGPGYANVWLGTTVEDQKRAEERIPQLLSVPARVRFLSCEPLLEAVNLDRWFGLEPGNVWAECLCDEIDPADKPCLTCEARAELGERSGIHWVIVGGESGGGSRAFDLRWAEQIVSSCTEAAVAVFVKQLGAQPQRNSQLVRLNDARKGGDITEFPLELQVRDFPRPEALR